MEGFQTASKKELDRRRVATNPKGYLICLYDEGGPDPLAELLGSDDPLLKQKTIHLERSYGTD